MDIEGRQRDDLERLRVAFDLPLRLATDLGERVSRASLRRHGTWIHLRLAAVESPEETGSRIVETNPIDVVAGWNVVATIHDGRVDAFDRFNAQILGESRIGQLDAAALVTALVDEVLSIYLAHVEHIEREVDDLDEVALRGDAPRRYLEDVIHLRRRVAALRRALAPHREAFGPLARPDFEIEDFGSPWPGLLDRLERTLEAVENVRDVLIGSVELQMSSTSQRVNDVMKRLTVLNAVVLPAALIAGIMGMPFPLPFFQSPANFWIVVAVMTVLAVVTLVAARFRGWI